jgi:hypothetical protein
VQAVRDRCDVTWFDHDPEAAFADVLSEGAHAADQERASMGKSELEVAGSDAMTIGQGHDIVLIEERRYALSGDVPADDVHSVPNSQRVDECPCMSLRSPELASYRDLDVGKGGGRAKEHVHALVWADHPEGQDTQRLIGMGSRGGGVGVCREIGGDRCHSDWCRCQGGRELPLLFQVHQHSVDPCQ